MPRVFGNLNIDDEKAYTIKGNILRKIIDEIEASRNWVTSGGIDIGRETSHMTLHDSRPDETEVVKVTGQTGPGVYGGFIMRRNGSNWYEYAPCYVEIL